jgi:hypothetical protein
MKTCAVCSHPLRKEIDQLLVNQVPLRDIAAQNGTSSSALFRHSQHIPGALLAAKGVEKAADAESLLDQVRGLVRRANSIMDKAEKSGKLQTALAAIREARCCLELLGKISGELQVRPGATPAMQPNDKPKIDTEALIEKIVRGCRQRSLVGEFVVEN